MATQIINPEMDALISSVEQLKADIQTLHTPLAAMPAGIAELQERALAAYATDTASGDIVTFPDGADDIPVKSATFAIDPIQDLNGYDSPWPAGRGANLLEYPALDTTINGVTFKTENGKIRITGTNGSTNTAPYNATTATTYDTMHFGPYPAGTYTVYSTFPSVSGATRSTFQANYADNTYVINGTYASTPYTFTATAPFKADVWVNIAPNETVDITAQLVMNKGEAIQSWTPYSNVCPISGWDGANIYTKGENLFEPVNVTGTNNGVTFAWVNGICTVTGTATALAINGPTSRTLPAGTYTVINFNRTAGTGVFVSDTSVSPWATIANTLTHTDESGNGWDTFTLTKTTTVAIRGRVSSGVTVDNAVITPMVVSGTVRPSAYAAYTATTIPITWSEAGTVYGGTLEYFGGESWRVTRTMAAVNPTSVISSFAGTGGLRIGVVATNAKPFAASAQSTAIANILKSMTAAAQYTGTESAVAVDAQGRCCISVTGITTFDALNSWLASNSLTCVYPLATPQSYDLTADELTTLLGTNNVWADTGSAEVEYRADTALYIAKKIAEAQA